MTDTEVALNKIISFKSKLVFVICIFFALESFPEHRTSYVGQKQKTNDVGGLDKKWRNRIAQRPSTCKETAVYNCKYKRSADGLAPAHAALRHSGAQCHGEAVGAKRQRYE